MSSDNLYIKRALRNLCVVYNEKPTREIIGNNNKILNDVYNEIAFDNRMLKIHRLAKFTNELAVTLQFINYKPQIKYITPDNYRVEYDSYNIPVEMWIPFYEKVENEYELRYRIWTPDRLTIKNRNLQTLSVTPNPYGEIPYVFISLDGDKDESLETYGGGLFELVKAQIMCNKLEFLINENLDYNGFAVWVLMNWGVKVNDIKFRPGSILTAEGVGESTGSDRPTVETIQPQSQYLDIEELKNTKMKRTLKNIGLPSSLIEDNAGIAASGVSMQIDRQELNEIRKEDVGAFRIIEDEIVNKFAKILNTDPASKYKGKFNGLYSTQLDFIEQSVFLEPDKEYEFNKRLFTDGLITPAMFVNRTISNDLILTDQDAINYLNENKQMLLEIGVNNDGSGTNEPNTVEEPTAEGSTENSGTDGLSE
jgi:hypothetical protein